MRTTYVTMKDGTEFHGVIWTWRPALGWVEFRSVGPANQWKRLADGQVQGAKLAPVDNADDEDDAWDAYGIRVRFDAVARMVTPNERVGPGRYGDVDELAKAQRQRAEVRAEGAP